MTKTVKPPESTSKDFGYSALRAGLSLVPYLGGPALEIMQLILPPPIDKRRSEWEMEVSEILNYLVVNQGLKVEDLQSNDGFIDTVIHASKVALCCSQEEKRKALRNAITNAALPNAPEQSFQQLFLCWIEDFTVWHIRLLILFDDPVAWAQTRKRQFSEFWIGGSASILEEAYPDLKNNRAFYDNIWRDLFIKGLVSGDTLHISIPGNQLLRRRTTDFGRQFLHFIGSPLDNPCAQ